MHPTGVTENRQSETCLITKGKYTAIVIVTGAVKQAAIALASGHGALEFQQAGCIILTAGLPAGHRLSVVTIQ
jgi:hypothetical protein